MNDEQILRKLAEIEGYTAHERGFRPHTSPDGVMERGAWGLFVDDPIVRNKYLLFNPLDNAEQVLALVEKYDVWLESDGDGWHAMCDGCRATGPDLKRAICLAIIESKAVEKAA